MIRYKIVPYDVFNDIYLVKRRVLLFFWIIIGVGNKVECLKKLEELNKE